MKYLNIKYSHLNFIRIIIIIYIISIFYRIILLLP